QRLDHRPLEGRAEVVDGLRADGLGAAQVAQPVEQGRLEAAEAVLEARQGWGRERLTGRMAPAGGPVQDGAARIPEAKHPGRLVEGFPRGVVPRSAEELEPAL